MSTFIESARTSNSDTNALFYHNNTASSSPVVYSNSSSNNQQLQQQAQQQAQTTAADDYITTDQFSHTTPSKSSMMSSTATPRSPSIDDPVVYDPSIYNMDSRRTSNSSTNSSSSSTSSSSTTSGTKLSKRKKPVQLPATAETNSHQQQQPSACLKNSYHYKAPTNTTNATSANLKIPSHPMAAKSTKSTRMDVLHERPSICTTTNNRSFTTTTAASITPTSTSESLVKAPHHRHSVNNDAVSPTAATENKHTSAHRKKIKSTSNSYPSEKRYRKEKLRQAKDKYEQRMKQFYQQLTTGCRRTDCRNKFCASGRGGVTNLQPQSAWIMAIQLASMPDSELRMCVIEEDPDTLHRLEELNRLEISNNDRMKQTEERETIARPFLQSLFTSTPFTAMLTKQQSSKKQPANKLAEQQTVNKQHKRSSTNSHNSWSTEIWNVLRYLDFSHDHFPTTRKISVDYGDENDSDNDSATELESKEALPQKDDNHAFIPDDGYYQLDDHNDSNKKIIDSEGSLSSPNSTTVMDDSSSSTDEDDHFVIQPTTIAHSKQAAKLLHLGLTGGIPLESLIKWCKSIFQNWEGIGNSFLLDGKKQQLSHIDLKELDHFYQSFIPHQKRQQGQHIRDEKSKHPLAHQQQEQRQVQLVEAISNSFETLLERMLLNLDSLLEIKAADADQDKNSVKHTETIVFEWCRAIIALLEWMRCCHEMIAGSKQPSDDNNDEHESDVNDEGIAVLVSNFTQRKKLTTVKAASDRITAFTTNHTILNHKVISVLSKIGHERGTMFRKVLVEMMANLDAPRLEFLVKNLQQYLLDHYHTRPYKQGPDDNVVMGLKCLELIYHANMKIPGTPIISPCRFYNTDICNKLNIKVEFRYWRQVLRQGEGWTRSHPFLPTTSISNSVQRSLAIPLAMPSPLYSNSNNNINARTATCAHDYRFSWFSYPFILPPSIKRKIILMDAMSQMSEEYEDACVNHTLLIHAQKLLTAAETNSTDDEDTSRSSSANNRRMADFFRDKEHILRSATCPYLLLEIRRDFFVQDTLSQLSQKWGDLKKPLKVKFVEGGEEGMDQGGVQKEFFGVLFEKLVSPAYGLFTQDDSTRLCWFQLHAASSGSWMRLYEMMGVLMGLSVYNGVIMNLQFPKILWKAMVVPNEMLLDVLAQRGQLFNLEDLEEGWPSLGQGLRQLLAWDEEKQGGLTVEDIFCRDYDISMDVFGQGVVTTSLMPNGEPAVPVTKENRDAYVRDYCKHFMYTAQRDQILALRRGLCSVLGSQALSLLTADELEMVACGLRQGPNAIELDMTELESVTEYDDGYSADHPTIRQFWSIVHNDLTNEQRKQLLLFVTASDRVPVGGLKELTFYIQRNGPDSDRLPTALTCFSRLLLPEYTSRQKLRERLITAIENTQGFGLV